MSGTGNTPAPQTLTSGAVQAAEKIAGTGTANDNAVVPGEEIISPNTGLPEDPAQIRALSAADTVTTLLRDGVTAGNVATVAAFHNADNQTPSSFAYGLLTGGVAQLINGSGNLDRAREGYGDGMPVTGIQAGAEMLWNGASYDRQQGKVGVSDSTVGGRSTAAIAAGAAAAAVKASAGRLARVLVTATGTANLLFYDNATAGSGTVIGVIPSTATVGQVFDIQMPAQNGIWAASGTGTPGVTVSYY